MVLIIYYSKTNTLYVQTINHQGVAKVIASGQESKYSNISKSGYAIEVEIIFSVSILDCL
jgi:hypothetical protein